MNKFLLFQLKDFRIWELSVEHPSKSNGCDASPLFIGNQKSFASSIWAL
jgi:hypothetical protein